MPSSSCEHSAPGVSGLLVDTHLERDALLNSGAEALIFPEGFGKVGFPGPGSLPPLRLVPP